MTFNYLSGLLCILICQIKVEYFIRASFVASSQGSYMPHYKDTASAVSGNSIIRNGREHFVNVISGILDPICGLSYGSFKWISHC